MLRKYTVLYIDDEESNLRIFKNTFRRDFNIILAASANEAISILHNNSIDVLITDQKMPEITGLELLGKVQELFPHIPPHRLMISGYAEPDDINLAFEKFGLYKFISKPWDANNLRKVIFEVINKRYGEI